MRRGTNVSVEMKVSVEMRVDKREFPRAFSCLAEEEFCESVRDFDVT